MERKEVLRYSIPLVVVSVLVIVVIALGIASQNPDGFEWSLFEYAGVTEPEGGFGGIWSFLGEGMIVDVITGVIGIVVLLLLGYGFFWLTSRKTD